MKETPERRVRQTQAERRERSRSALLLSAARGLSRHGYGNLVLDQVAAEAGYTRGALYHLFAGKEDLALAVIGFVEETWYAEVGPLMGDADEPIDALVAVARGHVVYCRRDVGRVAANLKAEFGDRDHPVGHAIARVYDRVIGDCEALIVAGRKQGAIASGVGPRTLATAIVAAVEGIGMELAGQRGDVLLAERAVRGLLCLNAAPHTGRTG